MTPEEIEKAWEYAILSAAFATMDGYPDATTYVIALRQEMKVMEKIILFGICPENLPKLRELAEADLKGR